MTYYIFEALFLFFTFFLPGFLLPAFQDGNDFLNSPVYMSMYIILTFLQLLLMIYILSRDKNIPRKDLGFVKPELKDIFQALFLSFGLFILYFIIIGLVSLVPEVLQKFMEEGFRWHLHNNMMIPLLFLFCMITGYREELLFRSYLITRCSQLSLPIPYVIVLSVFSFSILHLYEGVIGFLFAFVSGMYLSLIFVKKKNIHIVAISHGLFNFLSLLISLIEFT